VKFKGYVLQLAGSGKLHTETGHFQFIISVKFVQVAAFEGKTCELFPEFPFVGNEGSILSFTNLL
jgi:hypothetical protein